MNFNQIKYGKPSIYVDGINNIDPESITIYNRIIADGGVSNLTRLNFFVKGLKTIYGSLTNVPVCYDAHWIGYKLGSGTGATAGQAVAKLYSLTVAGDAVQATAASQPLLLAHNGASSDNYWWGSGVSGNYVSTPSATANNITGDIEFIIDFASVPNTTTLPNLYNFLLSKGDLSTALENYAIVLNRSDGKIYFETTAIAAASTLTLNSALTAGTVGYIKVNRIASTGVVKFYTSTDRITFTQLGTNVSTAAGNLVTTATFLTIGYLSPTYPGGGVKIGRTTIANSIGGTPVVDFNPATYNAATSQTAWTSATGEVWTINTGTATTGYKGVLVDRTIVQGDGVDDMLLSGTLASRQYFTSYSGARFFIVANGDRPAFSGSSNSHLMYNQIQTNIFNGLVFTTGSTSLALNIQTIDFNNTNSKFRINSGADVTGSSGNQSSTTVKLFEYGGSTFGNVILNTLMQVNQVDNDTKKTDVYNLLKTINKI